MSEKPLRSRELLYKGRRRVVSFFGAFPEPEAAVWRHWFARHRIDPNDVDPIGGVAADDVACFVEYRPAGSVLTHGLMRRVQLEARALPFPPYPGAEPPVSGQTGDQQ